MDKNTLSNYGWIVIAVLVLSVMIALATPFGEYIKAGVESTTAGLFETSEKAMNVVGMSAQGKTSKLIYRAESDTNYTVGKYINTSGTETENSAMAYTSLIDVEQGEIYYFSYFYSYNSYPVVALYDSDKNFISAHKPPLSDISNSYCFRQNDFDFDNYEKECNWITIPKDVSYIRFNVPKSFMNHGTYGDFSVYESKPPFEFHSYTSTLPVNNNLTGKSALFFGDSIGEGQYSGFESFPEYIASVHNMKYRNFSTPGYTVTHILNQFNGKAAQTFFNQLTAQDYVIVEGFINDVYSPNPKPIGTLSADGTTEFDTTTFIGTIEELIYVYKQTGCAAKLGFVLTSLPTRGPQYAQNVRPYWDAAISVFEKYEIEYLDLYDKTYSYADDLHPDYQGTYDMTEDIETWMNSF